MTLSVLSFFIIISYGSANSNPSEKRNELKKSIEKYRDENIFPKMLEWKGKIDKIVTPEELSNLNKLRADFKISKDRLKAKMFDAKSDVQKGYKVDKEKFHDILDSYRDEMKRFGKAVKPIAVTHLDAFKKIGEEAKPFKEKWKDDLKKIFEDWKKNNSMNDDKGHFRKFGEGMMGAIRDNEKLMALQMILWDGNKEHFMDEMESPQSDLENDNQENLAYPNPFDKVANIDFTLKNKENVKITVTDKNGNVIATLVNTELSEGFHSLSFKPEDYNIPNGLYLYRIESNSLNKTGKLMLTK